MNKPQYIYLISVAGSKVNGGYWTGVIRAETEYTARSIALNGEQEEACIVLCRRIGPCLEGGQEERLLCCDASS